MKRDEMPIGFSIALAQNPDAMQKFALLGEDKKKQISLAFDNNTISKAAKRFMECL